MTSTPEHVPEDWTPGNLPGPDAVIFLDPAIYPPIMREPLRCAFDDGEVATAFVLGKRAGEIHHTRTAVCDGHLEAVKARDVTWR